MRAGGCPEPSPRGWEIPGSCSPGPQDSTPLGSRSLLPRSLFLGPSSQDASERSPARIRGRRSLSSPPKSPLGEPAAGGSCRASKGSAKRNQLSKSGSALPGKRVGRNALLHARRARWDSPGTESGPRPRSCQASPWSSPAPWHSPQPSSQLLSQVSTGILPASAAGVAGSHLTAFPAHVGSSLAGRMGRGRAGRAESCGALLEGACPGWKSPLVRAQGKQPRPRELCSHESTAAQWWTRTALAWSPPREGVLGAHLGSSRLGLSAPRALLHAGDRSFTVAPSGKHNLVLGSSLRTT